MDGVAIYFIESRFPWCTLQSLTLELSSAKVNGDLCCERGNTQTNIAESWGINWLVVSGCVLL